MRDRAVELDEKFSEALAPRRSRDAGAVARVGGAGAPRRTSKKCIRRSIFRRAIRRRRLPRTMPRRRKRRAGRGKSQFADVNFPGRRSAGERARARRATYLDLGRLEGGDRAGEGGGNAGHFGVVKGCGVWCVCGNGRFDRGGPMFGTLRFCQLGRFFACSKIAFFHMAKQSRFPGENAFARVEQTSCQPGRTKSRLATKRRFERFPSGEAESTSRTANQDRHRVFPFQTRDESISTSRFSLSNARFRETGAR